MQALQAGFETRVAAIARKVRRQRVESRHAFDQRIHRDGNLRDFAVAAMGASHVELSAFSEFRKGAPVAAAGT